MCLYDLALSSQPVVEHVWRTHFEGDASTTRRRAGQESGYVYDVAEVSIGTFSTRSEAEVVQGLLESAGIPARLAIDDAGGAYPFALSGGARVLVDETDREAAAEVVASAAD